MCCRLCGGFRRLCRFLGGFGGHFCRFLRRLCGLLGGLIAVLDVAFAVFTPFSVALTVPLSAVFMVFSAFLTVVLIVRFPCCLVFINEFAAVWGVSVRKTRQRKLPLSMPARYLTIRAGYLSACLPSPH